MGSPWFSAANFQAFLTLGNGLITTKRIPEFGVLCFCVKLDVNTNRTQTDHQEVFFIGFDDVITDDAVSGTRQHDSCWREEKKDQERPEDNLLDNHQVPADAIEKWIRPEEQDGESKIFTIFEPA